MPKAPLIPPAAALAMLLLLPACGEDSPVAPGNTDPPAVETYDADPAGTLLRGDADRGALDAVGRMLPSPAPATDVDDGLITTRLSAVLAPEATVGEVNAVLQDTGTRIVAMTPHSPFVSLVVPAVSGATGAETLAAQLAATDAFLFGYGAREARPAGDDALSPGSSGRASRIPAALPDHILETRTHAAWNAKALALDTSTLVTVIVPDYYDLDLPHPQIGAQSFPTGGANTASGPYGNTGFVHTGILGANPDAPGTPGVHPLPEELLQIWSIPIAGLSWNEVGNLLSSVSLGALASTAGRLVISTSLDYGDPTFAEASLAERALDALAWRMDTAVQVATGPVVHVTASGTGELQAAFASPFALAAYQDDLPAVVQEWAPGADPEFLATLQAVWTSLPENAKTATGNVVTVGASVADGTAFPFSPDDEMVRDPGIGVPGPCALPTLLCVNGIQEAFGSGAATPQVAGLAAYLWSLNPTLSPVNVLTHLTTSFLDGSMPGFTDAYAAVLALDPNLQDPRVRRTILDLDENGQFDQVDVSLYLSAFEFGSSDLRFDLNGDAFVGGSGTAWFDLDANGITPNYTDVTLDLGCMEKVFNEKAATDRDILVYYAYSSLYDGDEAEREALLEECGGTETGVATPGRYDITITASAHILGNGPGEGLSAVEEAGGSLTASVDTSGSAPTHSASASGSASVTWAIALSAETGGVQLATWSGDLASTADITILNNGWGIAQSSGYASLHLPLEVTGAPVGWTLTASGGGDNVVGRYDGLGIDVNETTLNGKFAGTLEPGPHNLRITARTDASQAKVYEGPGSDSAQASGTFSFTLEFGAP